MADSFRMLTNRIVAKKDDHTTFDTDYRSATLYPEAYAIRRTVAGGNPISIEFPDLLKANGYFRWGEGFYSGGTTECRSFTTVLYQEWGPDYPNMDDYYAPQGSSEFWANLASNFRTLPQEYIGSVPAEADYLDVRVRLTNTVVPSAILDRAIFPFIGPGGNEVHLPGGSCPIEIRDPLSRLFEFKLVGTAVYLRRFQSVFRGQQMSWLAGNSDAATSGWTWGNSASYPAVDTPGGFIPHGELGRLAYLLDHKGPDTNGTKRRGGTNACSLVDTSNFRSVWAGDVIIRPGRRTQDILT